MELVWTASIFHFNSYFNSVSLFHDTSATPQSYTDSKLRPRSTLFLASNYETLCQFASG